MLKNIAFGILKIISIIAIWLLSIFKFGLAVSKNKDRSVKKYKEYFELMSEWMELLENGYSLQDYLQKNQFERLAVYGGRDAGMHLVRQLRCRDGAVQYVIDQSPFAARFSELAVYQPSDELPPVDAVIVTPVWNFDDIKQNLTKRVDCPVISLKDMIAEVKSG